MMPNKIKLTLVCFTYFHLQNMNARNIVELSREHCLRIMPNIYSTAPIFIEGLSFNAFRIYSHEIHIKLNNICIFVPRPYQI